MVCKIKKREIISDLPPHGRQDGTLLNLGLVSSSVLRCNLGKLKVEGLAGT